MATDMMVWNITKDNIVKRMTVSTDEAWDVHGTDRPSAPAPNFPGQSLEWILKGRLDTTEAESMDTKRFQEEFGIKWPPRKAEGWSNLFMMAYKMIAVYR